MSERWSHITATQNDEAFFEDYVRLVLSCAPAKLPERTMRLGSVEAGWFPTLPGTAHIFATGGTPLDRRYAYKIVAAQLEGHGIQPASYSLDWDYADETLIKEAGWPDIQSKATRLIKTGKVKIVRNAPEIVAGVVEGDHGTYNTEIQRNDPNSQSIAMWSCECKWDQFAWQRTRQWKRLEGRVCSHVLATYWQALATPLDEEIGPGSEGPQEPQPGGEGGAPAETGQPAPGAQPSPFGQAPGGGTGAVPPAGAAGPQKPGMPNQVAPAPQPSPVPGQAPEPQSLIPQYPLDPALQPAINPVSVPGQKPQSPLNPVQNAGGTFSHVAAAQFRNGDMVQLKQADHGQTVGLNAGETKEIPTNSIGEVLGTDPLGLVNVYFAGPQAEAGRLESHGITGWFWPNDLIARPDVPPAGPATRRR
jgi:hypothetical protein